MEKSGKSIKLSSNRKRFAELKERKRLSSSEFIGYSRSTLFVNLIIELIAGVLFAIGLFYILWFIRIRKSYMELSIYRLILGGVIIIGCVWFGFLLAKIRAKVRLLRRNSTRENC